MPGRHNVKLQGKQVEKPWGRVEIPGAFGPPHGKRIGEIWFDDAATGPLPLLVKYIFTSERLSIQVHPDDRQAQQRGLPHGGSECWYVVAAEPGATIGLGLREPVSRGELRSAALTGSIEALMDWKPVVSGDFFFVPPGTIHAIGADVTIVEVQRNADITYRLYDYGRPRELHLDLALSVADPGPYPEHYALRADTSSEGVLLDGPHFSVVQATSASGVASTLSKRVRWVVPIQGMTGSGREQAGPGECLLLKEGEPLEQSDGAVFLIAVAGHI